MPISLMTSGCLEEFPLELDEEVREFLIECNESLVNLDQEIILLEQTPQDRDLIASVFRTIHTIKGTCGFFGFNVLNGITHVAENILDQVRSSTRAFTPELSVLLLETVDAVKAILLQIEQHGLEGEDIYADLRARLEAAYRYATAAVVASIPAQTEIVAPAVVPREVKVHAISPPAQATQSEAPAIKELRPQEDLGEASALAKSAAADSTIRVDVGLLDKLMNLVGELVLARNQLLQGSAGRDTVLVHTVQRLNVITSELQESVLKTRMQPIGVVWNKLPRVVRDLASACGKKIRMEMEGTDTELDKTIIEAIKDPLTHIVRNACDHGIEAAPARLLAGKSAEGMVTLRAYHEGGHVNIEILDDGRGLDAEKIKTRAVSKGLLTLEQAAAMCEREAIHLVFAPGFSTAEAVTTISGRGVGMDVVKTNIQKIGGIVDIANRSDAPGSVVKITIPLTLAIIPGLIVRAADRACAEEEHRFVIPQASLLELVRLEREEECRQVEYVNGHPVFRRRGKLLPLTYLNRVLGLSDALFPAGPVTNIVVVQAEGRPFGLVVDGISDTQEIVVKPLSKRLNRLSSYLGSTIMGDGRVALILDIPGLAHLAGMDSQAREARKFDQVVPTPAEPKQSFLIFQAAHFTRIAVPLALVSRLEQIEGHGIELAAGRPVLHYRGEILPLLELAHVLDAQHAPSLVFTSTVQVIVLGEGSRRLGVVVDRIVDIVEDTITYRQQCRHPGLMGSAVLGDAITDLLDVEGLLERVQVARSASSTRQNRVLLYEPSRLARTLRRSMLEMQGYLVDEADTFETSRERLAMRPDLFVAAWDATAERLVSTLQDNDPHVQTPVISLCEGNVMAVTDRREIHAVVPVHDRDAMLQAIVSILHPPAQFLKRSA